MIERSAGGRSGRSSLKIHFSASSVYSPCAPKSPFSMRIRIQRFATPLISVGSMSFGRRKLIVPDWENALVSSWKPSSSPAPGSAPRGAERPRWRHFLPSKYSNASTSCSLGFGRGMMLESDSCISIEMYASAVCSSSSHARYRMQSIFGSLPKG